MVRPPYQAVYRLYFIADERWPEIDAAYAQVDLVTLPVDRFLNCIYTWCVERIEPDKRVDWDMQLVAPLEGEETRPPTEAQIEAEGQDFMAVLAQQQAMKGGG